MKTTGQIITPTDKLNSLYKEISKIFVPRISAIIAFVIKTPDRITNILFNFFSLPNQSCSFNNFNSCPFRFHQVEWSQ